MAPYVSDDSSNAEEADELRAGRRKAARYVVPVAVVGIAAATIGLVPAIADSGDPDLPEITAQQLIEKIAKSDVQQLSGTFKITTDLGLPDLGGLGAGFASGAMASGSGDGSSADPSAKLTELASGTHTLRLAVDGDDKQKLSLLENASEYSLIHNGKDIWGYDSKSNEVYHGTGEEAQADKGKPEEAPGTPKELTEEALKAVDDTTSVTVDGTAQVAGRDAYRLLIKPKQSGSTVGAITVAVDAKTGMPLKFTLTPSSGGSAVIDAGFTQVSFAKPAASTFDFTPPKGATVTEEGGPDKAAREHGGAKSEDELGKELEKEFGGPLSAGALGQGAEGGPEVIGEGWNSVAVFDTGGEGVPSGAEVGGDMGGFLDSLGDKATGKFGSGTVFSTRLINALVTDDGKVYVGAVTKDALVKAADSGK
ncbi:outer membrane lipoprotein carrier protein LolA [Streptomyces sp. uw30]|uniref:LolA family protein n=1 Tax=Streptomyces sp. uw30 TaxID=1828179 RepID=UPI0011CDAF07|nr:outer membrane lipoprotein carrier protein LolA [Streptomyces sp. uw30]TXS50552.1 outer membrane lipoprotein carrier protein LolA [Streptomyces sp. uw30]